MRNYVEVGDQEFNLRPTSGAEEAISKHLLCACPPKDTVVCTGVDIKNYSIWSLL